MTHIEIAELVVRMPGVSAEDVPVLVDDVLRRVQDRLHGHARTGHVRLAELHLTVPAAGGREALVGALVDGIAEALHG